MTFDIKEIVQYKLSSLMILMKHTLLFLQRPLRRQFCLHSLGTKGTLHTQSTLHNYEPVPQVLKQVINLSCFRCHSNNKCPTSYYKTFGKNVFFFKQMEWSGITVCPTKHVQFIIKKIHSKDSTSWSEKICHLWNNKLIFKLNWKNWLVQF